MGEARVARAGGLGKKKKMACVARAPQKESCGLNRPPSGPRIFWPLSRRTVEARGGVSPTTHERPCPAPGGISRGDAGTVGFEAATPGSEGCMQSQRIPLGGGYFWGHGCPPSRSLCLATILARMGDGGSGWRSWQLVPRRWAGMTYLVGVIVAPSRRGGSSVSRGFAGRELVLAGIAAY